MANPVAKSVSVLEESLTRLRVLETTDLTPEGRGRVNAEITRLENEQNERDLIGANLDAAAVVVAAMPASEKATMQQLEDQLDAAILSSAVVNANLAQVENVITTARGILEVFGRNNA